MIMFLLWNTMVCWAHSCFMQEGEAFQSEHRADVSFMAMGFEKGGTFSMCKHKWIFPSLFPTFVWDWSISIQQGAAKARRRKLLFVHGLLLCWTLRGFSSTLCCGSTGAVSSRAGHRAEAGPQCAASCWLLLSSCKERPHVLLSRQCWGSGCTARFSVAGGRYLRACFKWVTFFCWTFQCSAFCIWFLLFLVFSTLFAMNRDTQTMPDKITNVLLSSLVSQGGFSFLPVPCLLPGCLWSQTRSPRDTPSALYWIQPLFSVPVVIVGVQNLLIFPLNHVNSLLLVCLWSTLPPSQEWSCSLQTESFA